MSESRRSLWYFVGAALLLAALSPVLLRALGRKRLRFIYATGALAPQSYAALAAKPGWKAWSVELPEGYRLNGIVRPPKDSTAPWVLYYSGNDATMLATGQGVVERVLGGDDWGAAVVAYRGFDGSTGTPVVGELRRDGEVILGALLRDQHIAARQVHLVAFSIGGHIAVSVAGAQAARGAPVASLSLLAGVDDIVMLRRGPFSRIAAGDDYQTRPIVPGVPAPVLIVQGTDDEALAGPAQGRDLAKAFGTRAEYVELEGVGHSALLTHAPTMARVHAFIAAHR